MKHIINRIESRMRAVGIKNQAELVRRTGLSSKGISKYLSTGDIPTSESLQKIAEALGVTMDYLYTGRNPPETNPELDKSAYMEIPLPAEIAAGPARECVEFGDEVILHKCVKQIGGPGEYVAFRVVGDSMAPALVHGDIITVNKNPDYTALDALKAGAMYAVRLPDEGGITVKFASWDAENKLLVLAPLNPAMDIETIKLRKLDPNPIIGVVVGLAWRTLKGTAF